MNKVSNIAIVGATGLVGKTFLELLEKDHFQNTNIHLIASKKSEGKEIYFRGKIHIVKAVDDFDFSSVEVVFFSAGAEVAKKYAPLAARKGCFVVDNSSCFRRDDNIPLVIKEVNPEIVNNDCIPGIVANPNCSTIQMLVALKPLHDRFVLKRIDVTTFQSVSGTGKLAQEELLKQVEDYLAGKPLSSKVYTKPIAFNAIPQCGEFQEDGNSLEEMKMVWETQKILDSKIQITATCVRVPILNGHSESIHIETVNPVSEEEARQCLMKAPGVELIKTGNPEDYPTSLTEADRSDAVYVGRIRADLWSTNRVNLWVVSDNLRKGAALNSLQIAEILFS